MNIIGVTIQRPSFFRFSRATAFAVMLWAVIQMSPLASPDSLSAGRMLCVMVFSCVSVECGVYILRSWRHLVLNLLGCVGITLLYDAVTTSDLFR